MSSRRAPRRPPPPAAPAAPSRPLLVWAAVVVIAGLLAYSNSFTNPFVLDDDRAVLGNEQIRTLWPVSVPLSPPGETPVARRPLVNLSFALNYAAGGLDPAGYHAGNLALLLGGALLLFGVVRRTLLLAPLSSRFGDHATALAGTCALLWVVHPLHTEIVNYVSQRTTALMGVFFLLTLYCSVRALDSRTAGWRAGAVLSCAAGMACKESMVTAPIVVLLFDRVFAFPSLAEAMRRRDGFYAALAGTWGLLAALMASGGRTTVGFGAGVSSWTYLLNQTAVLVDYLRLVFWPRALVVDYGMPVPLSAMDVAVPAALVAALAVVALAALKYRPAAGFLGVTFFITLAPTSSIVPIVTEVGAERRMYLPLAAIVVLVVCAAYRAGRGMLSRARDAASGVPAVGGAPRAGQAALAATAVLALALGTGTFLRNAEYASPEVLARTTVERRPHGRAYYSLGHALFEAGRREEAIGYFRRAAADFPGARFALGAEVLADGRLDDGIRELRRFIESMPEHPAVGGAHQMIGSALAAKGDMEGAIAELRKAVEIEPRDPRANALLGEYLLRGNAPSEAVGYLRVAVALSPSDAQLHDLLGTAYAIQGQLAEALPHFRRAMEIDPDHPTARANVERARRLLARGASAN